MSERADVVICGAGVIGASVAYNLALRGIASVVVERVAVAHGASGTAAGLLTPVPPSQESSPVGQLATRSMECHRYLAEELDGRNQYDFAEVEALVVATSAAERRFLEDAYGKERVMAPPDRNGWLDREVAGAVAVEGAAQIHPGKYTRTLLEAACAMGARVVQGDVQGIRTERGRVTAVLVSAETVETSRVVVAMGPWSAEAEAWLRMPVPVTPLKGQILHYAMRDAPEGLFSTLDGNYAVRKPDGVVFAGTTEEEAGFDLSPTDEARDGIGKWVSSVSSRFDGQMPVGQTVCLRPLSEDGLPLIGAVPTFEGAYIAAGHGRKGLMLSAATGELLTELIATGVCTSMDLGPFDPGRFRTMPRSLA